MVVRGPLVEKPMHVHIVKIGEPVPGEGSRPRRVTLLARALVRRGHKVTWWTSNWNHQLKAPRDAALIDAAQQEGFNLRLVEAPGYPRNLSPWRLVHHEVFARRLVAEISQVERPDVIWSCYPVVGAAVRLAEWAKQHGVPVIFDVRDLSPDIFVKQAPAFARPLIEQLVKPISRRVGRAFANADGLVGISPEYLSWAQTLSKPFTRKPSLSAVLPLGWEPKKITEQRLPGVVHDLAAKGVTPNGKVKFVFSGTLGRSYDVETIVGAAELLEREKTPVEFVVAGRGDKMGKVAAAAERSSNLVYAGWLDADELQILLNQSQVGLMAYTAQATQGLPNKIYEYVGSGLAVLNSLDGEAARFVDDTGVGVNYPPHDPQRLAAEVLRLAEDPQLLAGMRAAAQRQAQSQLVGPVVERMVDFAEQIYERRRAATAPALNAI